MDFSRSYKYYALGCLTFVYALHGVDRGLIILLLQPIKNDLHLSDTELGFLTGIAFGLFYATLGLPVARWADRGNRATITSIAIGVWSITVMACMLVTNFYQLVIARIAAGVGESGCMPPTYSLLGDYFPDAQQRTRAMSVYWLGGPLSSLASFVVGGWLNDAYGWRMTFLLMGAPGLLIAVLVKLTIAEPRKLVVGAVPPAVRLPGAQRVLAAMWRQPSSRHLSLGVILLFVVGSGMGPWYAAFMSRSHGMSTTELGIWLGLINGCGGIAGMLLGGYVSGRWFAHNERGQVRLSAASTGLMVPFFVLFLTLPRKEAALLVLLPLSVLWCFFAGPAFALLQRLVAQDMRATTLAVIMLLANLIGMGVGPQVVGILSDVLTPSLGRDALRYAMLTMSLVALWSAYHFWRVGETVRQDLAAMTRGDCSSNDSPSGSVALTLEQEPRSCRDR